MGTWLSFTPHVRGHISILTPEAPNQPSPDLLGRFPLLLSLLHPLLFPSPQILIFHRPYGAWGGRSRCPPATTAPGLGLALVSSRHSTRLALHPLPNIFPKINQKMIIPSWRSIKGRSSPHSSLIANQDSQKPLFSFYIPPPPPLFSPFLGSRCFTGVFAPERSVITAACFRALTPPASLLPLHRHGSVPAGLEVASTVLSFHGLLQIKREAKQVLRLFKGWLWSGGKGF